MRDGKRVLFIMDYYNVVLISAYSKVILFIYIYIYIYIFFLVFFSMMVCHSILNISTVLCAIQ